MKNFLIAISIIVLGIISVFLRDFINVVDQDEAKTRKNGISPVELSKKFTAFYKNASDVELDKFIQKQTDAKASALPVYIGSGVTLYRVSYSEHLNSVIYGYEVDGEVLDMSEQELLMSSDTIKQNLKEHHINYFCTFPESRMELDIGIKFEIVILLKNSKYLASYTLTKDNCSGL